MNEQAAPGRKVRARLRRYERKLRQEKATYGAVHDGAGSRYQIGPLYLLIGDLEGALGAFQSFTSEFPDDVGEPGHYLCWTLALLRAGDEVGAAKKLRRTMLCNLYLVPRLLGEDLPALDIRHGSSDADPSYIGFIPREYFAMWEPKEREWAARRYHDAGSRRCGRGTSRSGACSRAFVPGPSEADSWRRRSR